jgi:hypothetical protein
MSVLRVFELHRNEVGHEVADVASYIRPRKLFERDTGAFKGLEHDFQQLPLLGIHEGGLQVVDAEESVFERPDVFIDEVAPGSIKAAWTITIGMIEPIDVESGGRKWPLSASASLQKIPKFGTGRTTTR